MDTTIPNLDECPTELIDEEIDLWYDVLSAKRANIPKNEATPSDITRTGSSQEII